MQRTRKKRAPLTKTLDGRNVITEYELYSDERETTLADVRYLFLGGVICTDRGRQRLLAALRAVRSIHALGAEMKWGRVSSRHLDGYRDYLRVFFSDPHARFSMFQINQSAKMWNSFLPRLDGGPRRDDRLASAFHQFLLVTFGPLRDTKRWTIYHDSGFFSKDRVLKNVEFRFNRTYKRAFGPKTSRIIRFSRSLDSKAAELIQLADLLLGAASCDALAASVESVPRRGLLEEYRSLAGRYSRTPRGFPKIGMVEWVSPDTFNYDATRRPTSACT